MHSYAEQLRAAGVACFPCWARYNSDKGRYDKGPSVPRGESWQAAAHRPYDDPALNWSSGVIGVPVPAGVVVFDQWSSGEFWGGGAPENYVSEHIEHQWGSRKDHQYLAWPLRQLLHQQSQYSPHCAGFLLCV